MEEAADPLDSPEDAAFDAFVAALARGETPQVDDWVARYGDTSGELRKRLESLSWMTSAPSAASDAPPFERLGDFRLIRKLGEGGMGVVWLAQQESLKRPVALKLIRAERLGSADVEKRFAREAEAVARLQHAHIVQVYAAGEDRGVRYLAMEFVDGRTLAETLTDAVADGVPIQVPRVLRWIADVASALATAHENGIVHRDVKPANIVIRTDGRALLADFGLARDVESKSVTMTYGFLGTPSYAAPEQIDATLGELGPLTDVYSLGATLYEAVTGVAPFSGTTTEQVLHGVVTADLMLPRKRNASLSRDLETVILKAMERSPARRYATAADFAADLEALLALRPIAARPPGFARRAKRYLAQRPLATAAGVLVIALAIVAPLVLTMQRRRDADATIGDAYARIAEYVDARTKRAETDRSLAPLREVFVKSFLPEMHKIEMRQLEAESESYGAKRDAAFFGAIGAIERAERLGADDDRVRRAHADLYIEAWRDALARNENERVAEYAGLLRQYDVEGRYGVELDGFGTLTVRTTPAGAECWLFRYEDLSRLERGGEPRLVPVPVGDGAPLVRPGATVLRVVRGAGDVAIGDLVTHVLGRPIAGVFFAGGDAGEIRAHDVLVRIDGFAVANRYDLFRLASTQRKTPEGKDIDTLTYTFERDGKTIDVGRGLREGLPVTLLDARIQCAQGGVAGRVVHDGVARERELPAGLQVRYTAAALAPSPACSLGVAPVTRAGLAPGSYVLLVRAEGFEPQRNPFVLVRGGVVTLDVALLPEGTTPPGFAYVPPGSVVLGGDVTAPNSDVRNEQDVEGFFIQDNELIFLDYVTFLEDPETRAAIDESPTLIRMPRWDENLNSGGYLQRNADGRIALKGFMREWPIMGVSHDDAVAYVEWLNANSQDSDIVYDLPTYAQWEKAARGADERWFAFGNRCDPGFTKLVTSRQIRGDTAYDYQPEAVLSFPVDESPYGVFDLTGSMSEYMRDTIRAARTDVMQAEFRGSSWGDSHATAAHATMRQLLNRESTTSNVGFRLVARRVTR